jgi:hypothetical protein
MRVLLCMKYEMRVHFRNTLPAIRVPLHNFRNASAATTECELPSDPKTLQIPYRGSLTSINLPRPMGNGRNMAWHPPPLSCNRARSYYGGTECHAPRASLSKRSKKARSGSAKPRLAKSLTNDGSGLHTVRRLPENALESFSNLRIATRRNLKVAWPAKQRLFARDEHQIPAFDSRSPSASGGKVDSSSGFCAPCLFLMTSVPCGGSEHTPCHFSNRAFFAGVPPLDSSFLVTDWGSGECGGRGSHLPRDDFMPLTKKCILLPLSRPRLTKAEPCQSGLAWMGGLPMDEGRQAGHGYISQSPLCDR